MVSGIKGEIDDYVFVTVRTNLTKARELATQALSDSDRSEVIILNPHDGNNYFARLVYARLPRDSSLREALQERKDYHEISQEEFKKETDYDTLLTISHRFQVSLTEISLGKYRSNRIRRMRQDE